VWLSSESGFIPDEKWRTCAGANKQTGVMKDLDAILDQYAGRRAFLGIDLGSVSDFTSVVIAIEPLEKGGVWKIIPLFWIPEDTISQRPNKDIIESWVYNGYIELTPGDVTDHNYTEARIKAICARLNVVEVAYDRYKMDMMVQNLMADEIEMTPFGQGYVSMSPAVEELEKLVLQERLDHDGNPVLAWMNGNVVTVSDPSGNRKFAKDKVQDKIDGIVALSMALARGVLGAEHRTKSIYNERGVIGFTVDF
jgi:phage terminase large subunit-like protein